MLEIEQSAERLGVRSDRIELAFHYGSDRWSHELSVLEGDGWTRLIRSVEGGAEDLIPPSPALQDLRLEQLGERVFEFQGMGQAGAAIYSAAIRLDVAAGEVAFDLCVRGKRADSAIQAQARYAVLAGIPVPDRDDATAVVKCSTTRLRVVPTRIEAHPACECRWIESAGTRQIAAGVYPVATYASETQPRSIRWAYRIAVDGLP